MAAISKQNFFVDLHQRIEAHGEAVTAVFHPLSHAQLNWRPAPNEWNILQCFEHLNLTHDYYAAKIEEVLPTATPHTIGSDPYKPSFWGRIYMYFAFNPRYSFPTADEITPNATLARTVLDVYLHKQEILRQLLAQAVDIDLVETGVNIEKGIRFNLGDCLKIMVYHDELHIGQAGRVLDALKRSPKAI